MNYELFYWLYYEFSYIKGKLYDAQIGKYTIPNIDDIPQYLAKQPK